MELEAGTYCYEWFDPAKGKAEESGPIESSGGTQQFKPPFVGEAVLNLKSE